MSCTNCMGGCRECCPESYLTAERDEALKAVEFWKDSCEALRKSGKDVCAQRDAARAELLAPTRHESNGEAGDGQTVCTGCGAETEEPHAWKDCAELLADMHRRASDGYCDEEQRHEETRAELRWCEAELVLTERERESLLTQQARDHARGSDTVRALRLDLDACRLRAERAERERDEARAAAAMSSAMLMPIASLAVHATDEREARRIDDPLACSFCGKTSREVTRLVQGPCVQVCDECIRLCADIIAYETAPTVDAVPAEAEPCDECGGNDEAAELRKGGAR